MARQSGPQQARRLSDERLFAIVAAAVCVMFGIGFCVLMLALNRREDAAGKAAGNVLAHLILPDHPRRLVDFSLTDRTGRRVARPDLKGKILVVDFLFTGCSVVCPTVNSHMAQIQDLTSNQPDVELVSLTVDPRDDTPAVLEKYGERFGADTNRWLLLSGEKPVLYHLIGNSFLAQDLDDPFSFMPGNFSHAERIAVVDGRGNLRGYFDGLNASTPAAVVQEIAKMRNENL